MMVPDMPDANRGKGDIPAKVIRLPQPESTAEARGWNATAFAYNVITHGEGLSPKEIRSRGLAMRMKMQRESPDDPVARVKYSNLSTRMEMAAAALAAGSTFKQACAVAGVSLPILRKWRSQVIFRERVAELQSEVSQGIKGRIVSEFERRTRPDQLSSLEVADLTRIYDRVSGDTPQAKTTKEQLDQLSHGENFYINLTQQILAVDAGQKGGDFPEYGAEELSVSGDDPPIDG